MEQVRRTNVPSLLQRRKILQIFGISRNIVEKGLDWALTVWHNNNSRRQSVGIVAWLGVVIVCFLLIFPPRLFEPHREKTGFLPRRKQRSRSASR